MSIKRMLLLASMALAAIAFAAPAAAQAQLLYERGPLGEHIALKKGAEVTETSTNLVTHTVFGTIECALVTFHTELKSNGASKSELVQKSAKLEGCNATITNPNTGNIVLQGTEAGITIGSTFIVHIPGVGECHFHGNIPLSYETNTDTLHITGENQLQGTPDPLFGKATITGTITLETANGTPVFIT